MDVRKQATVNDFRAKLDELQETFERFIETGKAGEDENTISAVFYHADYCITTMNQIFDERMKHRFIILPANRMKG